MKAIVQELAGKIRVVITSQTRGTDGEWKTSRIVHETQPDGTPWTFDAVNRAEFGTDGAVRVPPKFNYVHRQKDGSFYLSGLVLSDLLDDDTAMAETNRLRLVADLYNVIKSGVVWPGMVALQFAPTPFDFDCSPGTCQHAAPLVNDHDSAVCEICKTQLGWWCPDSPDQLCHYYTEDGAKLVKLRDGSTYNLVETPEYETEDCCLFCGNPEERK